MVRDWFRKKNELRLLIQITNLSQVREYNNTGIFNPNVLTDFINRIKNIEQLWKMCQSKRQRNEI